MKKFLDRHVAEKLIEEIPWERGSDRKVVIPADLQPWRPCVSYATHFQEKIIDSPWGGCSSLHELFVPRHGSFQPALLM